MVNNNGFKPSYLKLLDNGSLDERVEVAYEKLKNCILCPHTCGVNRIKGETGVCNTGKHAYVASAFPHIGEEAPLVGKNGSGTIFFSNCNLLCVFCQNHEISHYGHGSVFDTSHLSKAMIELQNRGCHNINLVTPSHVIPQSIAAVYEAAKKGLNVPIVYNSSGYDAIEGLKLLEDIVDIHLIDLKFSCDEIGKKYTVANDYFTISIEALKEMYRQVGPLKVDDRNLAYQGLIIRHLVLPNGLAGSKDIFEIINEHAPGAGVNIMAQYSPAYKAFDYPELRKSPSFKEFMQVRQIAEQMGLNVRL